MTRPTRRLVTDLLKLLPELGRAMHVQRQLHLAQLKRQVLDCEGRDALREVATRKVATPTPAQIQLAIELAQEGPSTVRELAKRLGVTAPAVSLLVDRMAEHGWVERDRDSDDRRVVWVRLSPVAQAMADAVLRVQRELMQAFVESVPPAEREAFVRNLGRFSRVLAPADNAFQPSAATGAVRHAN